MKSARDSREVLGRLVLSAETEARSCERLAAAIEGEEEKQRLLARAEYHRTNAAKLSRKLKEMADRDSWKQKPRKKTILKKRQ